MLGLPGIARTRWLAPCLTALFLACPMLAAQALTLEEAFVLALRANPGVAAAREQIAANEQTLALARSVYYPQVAGTASTSRERLSQLGKNYDAAQTLYTGTKTRTDQVPNVEVTAALNIYHGGQDDANVEIAKNAISQAKEQLRNAEQTVLQALVQSYLVALDAATRTDILNKEIKDLSDLDTAYARMAKNRLVTLSDRYQITAQLDSTRSQLAQARQDADNAAAQLDLLLGQPHGSHLVQPDLDHYVPARDVLESAVQHRNPTVASARYQVDIAKGEIDVAIGQALPTVSIQSSYNRVLSNVNTSTYPSSFPSYSSRDRETDWQVGLVVSMPLYTGGGDTARIRQARHSASAAQSSLDNQLLLSNSSFASAWYLRTALAQELQLAHRQVVSNQIVVDGQTKTNRDGLTSIQDLLRSRQTLIASQISESQLRASLGQDDAQLLALAGMLNVEDMGIDDGEAGEAGDAPRPAAH